MSKLDILDEKVDDYLLQHILGRPMTTRVLNVLKRDCGRDGRQYSPTNRDLLNTYVGGLKMRTIPEFVGYPEGYDNERLLREYDLEQKKGKGKKALFFIREERTSFIRGLGKKAIEGIEEYFSEQDLKNHLEQIWEALRPQF